jgi:hypothetical protein
MFNDLPARCLNTEIERNAYNTAFSELGFSWQWDDDTFDRLTRLSPNAAERIRHYLETQQPHLLKAYDAGFLVTVIQQKTAMFGNGGAAPGSLV